MRICIDCPDLTQGGARCRGCQKAFDAKRNADPKRKAYQDKAYRSTPLAAQCACCGGTEDMTRDHSTPLAKQPSGATPLVPLCRGCNSSKGSGTHCKLHPDAAVWAGDVQVEGPESPPEPKVKRTWLIA